MNILRYGIPRRIYHYMFSLSNCLTLFDVISLLALRLYIYSNTAFKQYTVQLYYVWSGHVDVILRTSMPLVLK